MYYETPPTESVPAPAPDPEANAIELAAGSSFDGYVLIDQLARGGFGTVWRAETISTGARVAIKVLHPHLVTSSEAVGRLEREAEAIAAIRHPNVVELYGYGRLADGRPYLVMELLVGDDLSSLLHHKGPMSPERALSILEAVCGALSAAHSLAIVHRDVKASNVVLSELAGSPRPVLLDFGLAKILETGGPELTASRSTLGTPSSMSPEQIRSEPVDARTDVYALGALAYHMLTGEAPFADGTSMTIHYMHLHSKRPRPSSRVDVSPAIDATVVRAMARNPRERFQSAGEFLSAFRAAVKGEAPTRRPTATGERIAGIYIDVGADLEALENAEDALIDDMESVIGVGEPILIAAGFVLAHRRGNSALFIKPVMATGEAERRARRRLVELVAVLRKALDSRPRRDPGVEIRVAVDIADATAATGDAESALLEVATFVVHTRPAGLIGSPRVFADLDLATERVCDSPVLLRLCDDL
jgi:serine/threonine-protein kinase